MRRLVPALLALVLLAACGGDDNVAPEPTPIPTAIPVPTEAEEPASPTPTPTPAEDATEPEDEGPGTDEDPDDDATAGATRVTAFFARAGESGVWVEPVERTLDEPTLGVARAAMELLVANDPGDPGLTSLTGEGVELLGVDIDGDVLTVDLSGELRNARGGLEEEEALAQQLAHTAAQFDGVARVRLLVDGGEISDLWGNIDWAQPMEPDPFALAPITIDTHTWGEQVPVGEITVGGEANTFEATVQLRLLGPDGDVIEETFTTATSGSGERGRWEHTFFLEGAATWTIEAEEPDPSDGEGRPPFTTRLEIRSA
jgi:hypothetical protein